MKRISRLVFLVFAVLNCVWPGAVLGQVPVVTSYGPQVGPIGTLVTISGTNFSAAASSNVVYFGAVRALVTDASPTSLMVVVPTGATYAPMTVTVNGLTAYANAPFVVTFPSPGIIDASSFLPKVDLATESNGYGLGIADLNNDGKSDLVVANYYNNLIVYQNQGSAGSLSTGSFAPYVDFKAGSELIGAAAGDLECDRNLGLLVISEGNPIISVFRNAGAGGSLNSNSFAQHIDYPARTQPSLVAIRDLDGDGRPEIIVTSFSGTVSVYRNASVPGTIDANSFASRTDFSSGSGSFALAVADLDGDGKAELVVGNFWDNTVSVFRNTCTMGNITSNSFAAPVTFTAGARPQGVAI